MHTIGLLGIFCGIAVAIGIFLSTYFLAIKPQNKLPERLLGFLFLAITIRLSKSIWYFIFYEVAPLGLMVGYMGLASIGPLLYLYVKYSGRSQAAFRKNDLFHVGVPVLGGLIVLFIQLYSVDFLYPAATALAAIYALWALRLHQKTTYQNTQLARWNTHVLIAVMMVIGAFVYQHIPERMIHYAVGSAIASIPLYYVLIYALRSPNFWHQSSPKALPQDISDKVKIALELEQKFLQPNLSLREFATVIDAPAYLVTKAVNQLYGKTFPEAINAFRIEVVKKRLVHPEEDFGKIESLAYDVGFNSPSAFYAAFKKETGMSPKAFQQAHQRWGT